MRWPKNMKKVVLRPSLSEAEAQMILPPMLNSERSPAKPAAMTAIAAFCAVSSCVKVSSGRPISLPPNISCSIGEAMPSTPIPADTLRHSTAQIIQNCGVLCASRKCTWFWVIIAAFPGAMDAGFKPSGFQPAGGTR